MPTDSSARLVRAEECAVSSVAFRHSSFLAVVFLSRLVQEVDSTSPTRGEGARRPLGKSPLTLQGESISLQLK